MSEQRTGLVKARAPGMALQTASADAVVTRRGKLARVWDTVELRLSKKQIYSIDGGKTFTVTAEGYRSCNRVAGMQSILAPSVPVDGHEQANPFVRRDPKSLKILEVFVRMALIGRSHTGNVLTLVQTIHYSPDLYFARDLFNAVKMGEHWDKAQGGYVADDDWKDAGQIVALDRIDLGKLELHQALYPLDETIGILVDLRSPIVNSVLSTRNENQIFAVRKAQTICERRLYQAHPGLPSQTLPASDVEIIRGRKGKRQDAILEAVAKVNVIGWVESAGMQRQLLSAAAALEQGVEADTEERLLELDPASALAPEEVEKVIEAEPAPQPPEPAPPAPDAGEESAAEAAPLTAEEAAWEQKVSEAQKIIGRLKRMRGGSEAASGLFRAYCDPEKELIAQDEKAIDALIRHSLDAIVRLKKGQQAEPEKRPPGPKPGALFGSEGGNS